MSRALEDLRIGTLVTVAGAIALGAAGLEVAHMRLPRDLAVDSERLQASGYGGKSRGRYKIGELQGDFTRIGSRVAVFSPLYGPIAANPRSRWKAKAPRTRSPQPAASRSTPSRSAH